MINDIKIITEDDNKYTREYLASYFRFIGLFVSDCNSYYKESYNEYDKVITVNDNLEKMNNKEKEKYINKLIKSFDLDREYEQSLEKLINIYVNNNLYMLIENALYYVDVEKTCARIFKALENIDGTNRYYTYTRNYLAMLVNSICRKNNYELSFDTRELIDDINNNIIFKNTGKNIANAKVLQGNIVSQDVRFLNDAILFYKSARENLGAGDIDKAKYMGYLYYKIGSSSFRYGSYEEGKLYLKKSIEANFNFANSHYALGYYYERKEDYTMSVESYKRAEQLLIDKYDNLYKKDILLKTEKALAEVFKKIDDRTNAISYYTKIINFNDKKDSIIVDDEVRGIKEDSEALFELAKLYQKIGDHDKADYYWERANIKKYTKS